MSHTVFLSDIHMQATRQDICAAFAALLTSDDVMSADAVYLLGDVVEYWLGDDTPTQGMDDALNAIKTLSNHGVPVFFQHGNRDFLVGNHFCGKYGTKLIGDPHIIDLYDTPTALLHGDTLCTDDVDYQNFRRMVRADEWQTTFLAKSLPERIETVKQVRTATTQAMSEKSLDIMDVNEQAVADCFESCNVRQIIHGHTHRPHIHYYPERDTTRIVLSDWDKQAHYLRVTPDAQEMRYIDFDYLSR